MEITLLYKSKSKFFSQFFFSHTFLTTILIEHFVDRIYTNIHYYLETLSLILV